MRVLGFVCLLCFSFDVKAALHAKKKKPEPLTHAQMVALKWRPTPTTAQSKKNGPFQGLGTIAAIPKTLR